MMQNLLQFKKWMTQCLNAVLILAVALLVFDVVWGSSPATSWGSRPNGLRNWLAIC